MKIYKLWFEYKKDMEGFCYDDFQYITLIAENETKAIEKCKEKLNDTYQGWYDKHIEQGLLRIEEISLDKPKVLSYVRHA